MEENDRGVERVFDRVVGWPVSNELTADTIPIGLVRNDESMKLLSEVLKAREERQATPRRAKGTSMHSTVDSFVAHVSRFKREESVIFAEHAPCRMRAIYNYHSAQSPGWGDHVAVYECVVSTAWAGWRSRNETSFTQDAFGDWIEEHVDDLASGEGFPKPAALIDMARNLVIHAKATFERKINPTTGESCLIAKEEHEASSTRIPRSFLLQLPVFEDSTKYAVEARIKMSFENGKPKFSYSLQRIASIFGDAYAEVIKAVREKTGLPIYHGQAE